MILSPLASLRLTVALFALSIVLVFFGTLALMQNGMWTVIRDYFYSNVVWVKLDLIRQFLIVFFYWPQKSGSWPASLPFPGGFTLAVALLVNMIAAHAVRFKFAWRRLGIIVLHLGLIALLGGEIITREFAVEATMTIQEGEVVNYVDVSDKSELAFVDLAAPESPSIVAIAHTALERAAKAKTKITDAALPFDVKVDQFFRNSSMLGLRPGDSARDGAATVTALSGVTYQIFNTSESTGVDQDARENATAARVTLYEKGTDKAAAVLFVSCWLDRNFTRRQVEFPPQTAEANGKTYRVELRQKRVYKPYSIGLKKFDHDMYPGTEKPKDFASTVRLIHPERGENREVRIWMNNPLRYDSTQSAGVWGAIVSLNPFYNFSETFFQSGYLPDDSGTVLQVVQNPSWLWPYVSCVMITAGMLIHFLMVLVKFSVRQWTKPARPVARVVDSSLAKPQGRFLPVLVALIVAALFAGYLGSKARVPKAAEGTKDLVAFGRLPVQEGGRVQPLDSFARNTMQALSNSEEYDVERTGEEIAGISVSEKFFNTIRSQDGKTKRRPAIEWLLSVMGTRDPFDSPGAKHKVLLCQSVEVLDFLGLERRPGSYRYSPAELKPSFEKLQAEYEKVREIDSKKRTLFQQQVFQLGSKLGMYQQIVMLKTPAIVPPAEAGGAWTAVGKWDEANAGPRVSAELQVMFTKLQDKLEKEGKNLNQIPPDFRRELAKTFEETGIKRMKEISDELRPAGLPAGQAVRDVLTLGRGEDAAKFNAAITSYVELHTTSLTPKESSRVKTEVWLNYFDPFYACAALFLITFVIGLFTWLGGAWPRFRLGTWLSAVLLLVITIAVMVTAMIARMYLMDRPFVFVTNLYSSAIFIGTVVAALCVVLELYSRLGVGTVVAAGLGFGTTYLARHLQATGDTLEMMQAVLDTNFWLATHVTTVTFGYAATFVAGGIALIYCGLGITTTTLRGPGLKTVSGMLYGTICFATLLSFVGTVLGGIWADQSWGRFWGWDPKENGALLIVAWNALILHARWAGLVKARGVAVLAIAGIAVTMWSWFGTNQLGIGLHAYGFNNTLATWCTVTWVLTPIAMIVAAAVPFEMWRSNRD